MLRIFCFLVVFAFVLVGCFGGRFGFFGFFSACFVFVRFGYFFIGKKRLGVCNALDFVSIVIIVCMFRRERWTVNRSTGYVMRREIMFVMRFLVNGRQPSLTLSINAISISAAKPPSAPLSQMGFTLYLL